MEKTEKISLKDTVVEGVKLYFRNIVNIVVIDLINIIPLSLYLYFISTEKTASASLPIMFLGFFGIVMIIVDQGAVYTIFNRSYKNETNTLIGALQKGFILFPAVFIVGALYGLAVLGGTLLLIIPGIVFGIKYMLSLVAVVVEDKSKGPMKLSALMAKGNYMYIFLICLVYIILCIPVNLCQLYPKNPFILFAIGIPVALLSTIAQAVLYTAYVKIRERKSAEIEAAENLKPLGETAGCFIIIAFLILCFIAGIVGAVIASKNEGFGKIMQKAFGSQIELSEKIKLDIPDKWAAIPGKKPYKFWMMMNMTGKTKGINNVMFFSLGGEDFGYAPDKSGYSIKKMLEMIKLACDVYYVEAKYEHLNPNFVIPVKPVAEKITVKGEKLYKMVLKGRTGETALNWTIYFGESAGRLVFLYYEKFSEKNKNENYITDVLTIKDMLK